MRECKGCRETKPFSEFSPHKGGRDGLAPRCKQCRNTRAQEVCKAISIVTGKRKYVRKKPRIYPDGFGLPVDSRSAHDKSLDKVLAVFLRESARTGEIGNVFPVV